MDFQKIPCIVCVSEIDLKYLFEFSLTSCLTNLEFLSEIFVITPNTMLASKIISEKIPFTSIPIHVISDNELLSKSEMEMCGWSKQQILKLRCNEITKYENILSVGADTVIIKQLSLDKFYNPQNIIVHYRKHKLANKHFNFEINRVKNIYNILGINTANQKLNLMDFIFDVFLFNAHILTELKKYLIKKFGLNYSLKIFPKHVHSYSDMEKIGEWSLYSIFAIEVLKFAFVFQNGSEFLHQIHTETELRNYNFKNEAIHFVRKDFDKEYILTELKKHNISCRE